jgi:hypothetical protein
LLADEVRPAAPFRRLVHGLVRAPLVALTYVVSQQTTHPLTDPLERVTEAGLSVVSVRWGTLRSFVEIVARKPERVDSRAAS